jgi:cytochrome c
MVKLMGLLQGPRMKKGLITAACLGLMLTAPRMVAQEKGDAAKGKETFRRCAGCHDPESSDTDQSDRGPDEQAVGPGLKALFKREKLRNGNTVTAENVRAVINGGGNGMPAFAEILSEEERDNVIAFLKTL